MAKKVEEQEAQPESLEQLGLRYLAAQEQRLRACQYEEALRKELRLAMEEAGKEALVVGPKIIILEPEEYMRSARTTVKDL